MKCLNSIGCIIIQDLLTFLLEKRDEKTKSEKETHTEIETAGSSKEEDKR